MNIKEYCIAVFAAVYLQSSKLYSMCKKITLLHVCICLIISVQFWICSCQIISTHPTSQSVRAGENATFHCKGRGSHLDLHWYINGVNTEDMTAAEISDRGLHVRVYTSNGRDSSARFRYAQRSFLTKYLTMTGNCLNNNTEIYCVIFEQSKCRSCIRTRECACSISKTTSSVASLTVEDSSSIIKNLNVKQFDETLVLVSWELQFVTVNYNQTLTIQDNELNTAEIMLLNTADRLYWHEMSNIDRCIEYSFTLNVIDSKHISCRDLKTVTTYIRGVPVAVKDVHMQLRKHVVIQFTVNSSVCTGSLPTGVKLLLLDNSGGTVHSSTTLPWEHLTIVSTEGVYQTEWNIHLEDNNNYQLMILSESMFSQAISDPLKISTFDVTDVQYTVHEATGEMCLKCIFTDDSLAKGCLVVLVSTDSSTAVAQSIRMCMDSSAISTSIHDCTTLRLISNGKYLISMSAYDWEENGGISDEAAVIRNIFINLTTTTQVSLLSLSATPGPHGSKMENGGISNEATVIRDTLINLTTIPTTQVTLLSLSATPHRSKMENKGISDEAAVIRNTLINLTSTITTQVSLLSLSPTPHRSTENILEQSLTATDLMTVALGILFCGLSLIVIAILILGVIILRKHRSKINDKEDKTDKTDQDEMPAITVQMNSAYKTFQIMQTKNSNSSAC